MRNEPSVEGASPIFRRLDPAIPVGLAILVMTTGCFESAVFLPRSSGSIGLSSDDRALFVADADHDLVYVMDTETGVVLEAIPVGRKPERVLVAPDDSVYVSLRGDRAVARISARSLAVAQTGQVGSEPVGMSLTGDGRLLVANHSSGTVSVLDASTLETRATIDVGGHPMAVVALAGDKEAYVTDYLGSVAVLNLEGSFVSSRVSLTQPGLDDYECDNGLAPPRTAALPADIVLAPSGRRAYVGHVQSRTGTEPGSENFGRPSLALAVAPALGTLETYQHSLMTEPSAGQPLPPDHPAPVLVSTDPDNCFVTEPAPERSRVLDAPSSLVVDNSGDWIYVADHNSNAVAIVSARRRAWPSFVNPERGIADIVAVGARPTGLAVRSDLKAAYVHNSFDYDVSVVERVDDRLIETRRLPFGSSTLDEHTERGRRLFYSAVDPRMTEPELGGVSCSSCHPDGRTDGLTWILPEGVHDGLRDGDRRSPVTTPALWGVSQTAPYLREGLLDDLASASGLMVGYMGGSGLTPAEAGDVVAYLRTIEPPDNPHVGVLGPELLERGSSSFEQHCSGCHAGEALTDGRLHLLSNGMEVVTPSLIGIFASPPYLHDGEVSTLGELLDMHPRNLSSTSISLSSDEKRTLEAYLKTL